MPRLHQRRMSVETDKVFVNVHRLKHRRMSVETEKVEIDVKHLHPRRKSVEVEKVENDLHRLKHRRMSVETESPSLLGYLHKRRWSWDTIHHISDTLHLTLKGKRRSTLPEEGIECEGEETHHGRFHHFTRSVSMTLRKKKTPVPALAIVEFENGNVKLLSSEDGGGLRDLLSQASMEYRISSYRIIMDSTRSILNSDSSCSSPPLDSGLEDVFEELADGLDYPKAVDARHELVHELLRSEREYGKRLRSILDIYAEPLRKFSSLTPEDHRVLFVGVEPILSISAMISTKLEDTLKTWDQNSSQIGSLFSTKLWTVYEEYCNNYPKTRQLLDEKYTSDDSFVDFCNLRRGSSPYSLDTLLHLPVQRIPDYEKYLSDLLEDTDPQHPDYEDLSKAANRAKTMVREHEDELGTNNDQIKMDRIQQRFPNDDLQLRDNTPPTSRSLSARRKSAPGAVLFKSLGKNRSSSNLWSNSSMGKKEMDLVNPLRHGGNSQRQFILEGHVEFAQGMQTQDRYLFLFNDLLLVAKQKSSTTFKLKHRIRVCEMWLATCIYDVSEATLPPDKSFVLGWPVTNVVATFKSVELKELWLNKLNETIELEKMKEANKKVKVKVHSRDLDQTCTLQIDNHTTAKDLLTQCVSKFHITESEASECQLWVKTGKEESPYPLIGHELPHSIKFSQLRDLAKTDDPMVSLDGMDPEGEGKTPEFILQNRLKGSKKHLSFDESNKGNKSKTKKSPFNFFKRGKDDKNNNTTPPGKLFGHPLQDVMQDGQLPKAVMELMRLVIINGPYTKGVFRKSCNIKLAKELHQKLDEGQECLDEETPTLVIGHLLKEYLRSLPHCLLYEEFFEEWISLTEEENSPQKLEKVRSLLNKLPEGHRELLKHLLCVLYHIDKNHKENMMTSYNLSVCIAPSILWAKQGDDPMRALAMAKSPQQIVEYLIVNCVELFGEDVIYLFGDLLEHKIRQDSSTDSDSMHSVLSMADSASGIMRHDDSSVDSLERMYFDDSSPNLAKSHISPSSLSRDSGLYSSQENLDNAAKSRVNTTLVKSRSGCHLYFEDEHVTYPAEITGPMTRLSRERENRLQRQKSVAESTPPTSPQSKFSYSSLDSSLTDSMSSYLNRQYSKDTDNSDQWFTADESFRESFESARSFKDDSSINFQRSNSLTMNMPKSIQNVQYLVSPPVSPRSKRKSTSLDLHLNLSQTKSFPLPRSSYSQDKLSDSTSTRYGQSAMDLSHSSSPLKQLSKYTTPGLGTSPPPHVVLQQHKSVQKPTTNTPMRASYDSAIISQFEKDTFKTEAHVTKHVPTPKSDSDSDVTLTNNSDSPAVSRPEKPPSYDEAVRRKNMIEKGLPLEISEQDIQMEKERQKRAKSLYEESIRKMNAQESTPRRLSLDESTTSESGSESTEEDVYVSLSQKNPKQLYEESMKLFEEQSQRPTHYENKNISNVNATNIQRSSSDSAEYVNKVSVVPRHREASPNYRVHSTHRDSSPSTTRLSHSSSSVSNSSSETVTDSRQNSPNQRDRSESSPVIPRHHFPKTNPLTFKANYGSLDSAQSSSSLHTEQKVNNPPVLRSSAKRSPQKELGVKSIPKPELSVHNPSSKGNTPIREKRMVKSHDFVDSPRASSPRTESQESPRRNLTVLSKSRDSTVIANHRDLYARSSTAQNRLSASMDSEKSQRKQDLPWSVKSLKQIYDGAKPVSDNVKDTSARPPPPPYQPPPPFRRPDTSRLSMSSQSSVGSGSTGRSTPPTKSLPSHRRLGGPQAFSYRTEEDPDISYV